MDFYDYGFAMIYLELKVAILKGRTLFKANLPLSLADLLLDPDNVRRYKKYVNGLVVSRRLKNDV